jgi:ribosomal protein L25 (general stress protein Ctc)
VAEKDVKIKRSPAKDVKDAKGSPAKMYGKKKSPAKMSGKANDNKEAYNKNLSASARLHYLENERADDKSPMNMYKKSPMNMYGNKSPLEKELVGKQNNLPPELKAKIEASPAKMYGKKESPMNMSRDLSYGGPVIDQEPKALSHMGASKVLRHMKGSSHSPLNMNGPGKPKQKAMKSDTVRGFDNYKVGDMVSEDDFESKFKKKGNNPKNYPQLSVQDYSNVQKDKKGKYVVKRND